jgi:hypothetical protein
MNWGWWMGELKFITGDGCQMVNVNILTIFYSLIMYLNMLFSKHSKFVIITSHKNQRVKPNKNIFQNPYLHLCYICNHLKTIFQTIWNWKQKQAQKIEQYVLIEPCYSRRFIPFIFECHQVSVLCVAHKAASRIMVLRDSHQLHIQFSFFWLTMSHTMKGIMVEHFSPNLVSRLEE